MLAIAVPVGIWSALRAGSRFDRTSLLLSLALFAVPSFWLAMLLQEAFAIRLHWLPLYGLGESGAGLLERLRHLILPSFALAVGGIAYVARFLRAHLLESRPAALLRGARARGRGMLGVFMVHGFRRSALPLLTLGGFLLPSLVSGSVLIETVFSIPGLGRLFYEAVLERDLPVLTVLVGISGVATLLGMLLADLLYLWAEPRLRERPDA
jgi:peptide/nickel transport system permease protein